jgi:hypothetical protein
MGIVALFMRIGEIFTVGNDVAPVYAAPTGSSNEGRLLTKKGAFAIDGLPELNYTMHVAVPVERPNSGRSHVKKDDEHTLNVAWLARRRL